MAGSQSPLPLWVYLADQHDGGGRSLGITRMTREVLEALEGTGRIAVCPFESSSSVRWGSGGGPRERIPWSSRPKPLRLLADQLHPLFASRSSRRGVWYYPKGFMPYFGNPGGPRVVTVHDTIIDHYRECYPRWRSGWDYGYWLGVLAGTLRHADRILTVSNAAKARIEAFMKRRGLSPRPITVTYEPCAYERIAQPEVPAKGEYVLHLGSKEPHKGTGRLIRCWIDHAKAGHKLPVLHVVGETPEEVGCALAETKAVVTHPYLADADLRDCYRNARALVFPSEIEGFGLPALEAYYLGTPVCYVLGTAVGEVLSVATEKGGFRLERPESLFAALDEVLAMAPQEVRACGLKLREVYAAEKVAGRMIAVFEELAAVR